MLYWLHEKVQSCFGGFFEKYGRFIARHPWTVICAVLVVDILLCTGVLRLTQEQGIEQYTPTDSEASVNRNQVQELFNIKTSTNFYTHTVTDFGQYVTVIIQRQDGGNILNVSLFEEIGSLYTYINNIAIYDNEGNITAYSDICAKRFSKCVVDGDFIFHPQFTADIVSGNVGFPEYTFLESKIYINSLVGGAYLKGKYIQSAKAVKLRFNILNNSKLGEKWELEFLEKIPFFNSSVLSIKYAYTDSIATELNRTLFGDMFLIAVTFFCIILFSSFVLVGGNCVVNRGLLAFGGILNTFLAIGAAMGLNGYCGVKFVDIVGAMPFLVFGIGVDDMFVLLSGLASTCSNEDIPTRIGRTMRHSGVSITITSLTDVVAFCVGATSIFPSVKYFSLYTGCAILFCYANYITFFVACMTINEFRVVSRRHCCTCMPVPSPEEMDKAGKSACKIICCSGEPEFNRKHIEGPVEKYLKRTVTSIVLYWPAQIIICLLFISYLGVSIWGVAQFKEGLDIRDLFMSHSYYYEFYDTDHNYFSQTLPISLNFYSNISYDQESTFHIFNDLIGIVKNDTCIEDGFMLSWIHSYKLSNHYNATSKESFVAGLQLFLNSSEGNVYVNDVVIDKTSNTITASRFHFLSTDLRTSNDQAAFMIRIRHIVNRYDLPVFVYSPAFILIENYAHVYSQTFQTLGICLVVIFGVTLIFIPLPMILLLVTTNVVFIMLGVIGFMHFWGLTLSSITMILIIMCVGFCIDFSTHICHAFVEAKGSDRKSRTANAIDMAGGAVFNGAMSTVVGIATLSLSSSQVFISFFKVMFLVMTLGLAHALLLLPIVLSCIGPQYKKPEINSIEEDFEFPVWEKDCQKPLKRESPSICSNDEIYEIPL